MLKPPFWVDPLMRVGYVARGFVYLLVGNMAFLAAVGGGHTPDSKSALAALLDKPFGKVMMSLITLGLIAYALWRCIEAAMDLGNKGDEAKGWIGRAAQFISGAVHLSLAISIAPLALGMVSDSGSNSTDHWTALLMQQPFGRWLVALVGIIVIAVGVQHFIKARSGKYRAALRYTSLAARLDPVLKAGLMAHGVVVCMVGAFFMWAAWTADPSRAGGMREALSTVRAADAGQSLLALLGLGLIGFALYCFIVAAFRIVPRCAPNDLETLASKARALLQA